MSIEKDNNIITRFMLWNLSDDELLTSKSWDKLMQVVFKIQSITTFTIRFCNSEMDEIYTECTTFKHGYLIEDRDPFVAVYNKCLNFIKSYNHAVELEMYVDIQNRIEQGLINNDLAPIKCTCGCTEFDDKVKERLDGHLVLEFERNCKKCGTT